MTTTIAQLIELYTKYFYLEDTSAIPFVVAIIISNRMGGDPVWGMLVGSSSSGKSELLNAVIDLEIEGKKRVWQVSSLTENTFLSGMANQKVPTSLLHRIGTNGIIIMKDFTTLLSEHGDRASMIFAQMREIYDGYLTKETGTGKPLFWKGKINFIGGVTEKIYMMEKKYGGMGTRAVNFQMPHSDRRTTVKRALQNSVKIEGIRKEIQQEFSSYINHMTELLNTYVIPPIDERIEESIIDVADFAALARSATERDYRGELQLTQSPEMPMRIAKQMSVLYNAFNFMNDGKGISEQFEKIIYKVGFDSIPMGRRMALGQLARFEMCTTGGIATSLRYPTATIKEWLEDLNVLGICERMKGAGADTWQIKEQYRSVLIKYGGIIREEGRLSINSDDDDEGGMNDIFDDLDNI